MCLGAQKVSGTPAEDDQAQTSMWPVTHLLPVLLRALRQHAVGAEVLQLLCGQVQRVRTPAAGAANRARVVLLLLLLPLPLLAALGRAVAACRFGGATSCSVVQRQ